MQKNGDTIPSMAPLYQVSLLKIDLSPFVVSGVWFSAPNEKALGSYRYQGAFSIIRLWYLRRLNRKQNPPPKLLQRTFYILYLGVMQEID